MSDYKDPFCILPLRDIVVFPNMIVPLFVGRVKSIKALEYAEKNDKEIFLVAQKDANIDEPGQGDIYDFGTVANILQLLKLPDGTVKVLVEGLERAKVSHYVDNPDFFEAYLDKLEVPTQENDKETNALSRTATSQFENYVKLNRKVPPEILVSLNQISDLNKLADTMSAHLGIRLSEKQDLLECLSVKNRLSKVIEFMDNEIGVLQVEKKIRSRVKRQMDKTQKEYYLNEQIKAIQKELGETSDPKDEIAEIEEKLKKINFSDEARDKVKAEIKKLKHMGPMSAEATVVRNYLDWIISIPWNNNLETSINLNKASKVLDEDHFGLIKVKDRIIEYLAVQTRVKKPKGPILCLVGPPGVGKTSLGKSIAKATNRQFVRMSLGGVRDEAEVRGHRRTYIGSLPGKIIQMMKKAGTKNPLFLLDEIDKVGNDYRGDPSSALLEALDPEQNTTFNDHYLEVDYDLSDVMFVTTANTLNILPPLLDRMEVIRIPGYTEDEKINIANKYLLPKQIKDNGVKEKEMKLDENIIKQIFMEKISSYYLLLMKVKNQRKENYVIIMAGGKGKRLGKITTKCPKPMLLVNNKPIIEHIIDRMRLFGFSKYLIAVNYLKERVKSYLGNGQDKGININYIEEEKFLGTAGSLSLLELNTDLPVIVLNGDVLSLVNFDELLNYFRLSESYATVCAREHSTKIPYGVIQTNDNNVTGILEKPDHSCYVNAGIYVFNPKFQNFLDHGIHCDMPELINKLIGANCKVNYFPIHEYWLDVGLPETLMKANDEWDN